MSAAEVLTPARQAGAPGYSAYQLAVQAGYTGTQAQWLASLIGPPADTAALNTAVTNATTSATSAQNSATAAYNFKTAAADSATAAGSSATTAGNNSTAAANRAADAGTSATAALNSSTASANSATLAQAWAMQTSGMVDGTSYSAKWYAQLAANWASQATGTVDDTSYSAKFYALLAANWAGQAAGLVDGASYSAKYYAQQAALSAQQAAGAGITPTGAFAVGDFVVAASSTGGTAKSGGAPAKVATTGRADDLTGTLPVAQLPVHGVANAHLAQMPTLTIKGNLTGATADAGDVSPSALLDSFGSTQGSVLYRDSAAWKALAPGTAGQVLQSAGAGANPIFATPVVTYPITGTSSKSAAYTLGSTSGDTGKVFLLTGSFPLTLPAASGGSATSPLWFHYSKRDGSGSCTLVLSGSDTWEDGTTAAKYVYQESGTVVSIGGGVWRFAPGTRQRGRVFAGSYTATSGAASVLVTLGFGDPDAQNFEFDFGNYVPSTGGNLIYTLKQGSGTATVPGGSTLTSAAGNATGRVTVRGLQNATAYSVWVEIFTTSSTTTNQVTSTGAVTGIAFTPNAGTITSMSYSIWIERP